MRAKEYFEAMEEKEERLRNLALRVAKQTLRLKSLLESSTDLLSEDTVGQLDEVSRHVSSELVMPT